MPTISPELILEIWTPVLQKFAKEFSKTSMAEEFLRNPHHKHYEENNLHAFLVEQIKDLKGKNKLWKNLEKVLTKRVSYAKLTS